MGWKDRLPLPNTPASRSIARRANNRFGAVLSATYNFWLARAAATRNAAAVGSRPDTYTVVIFDETAWVLAFPDPIDLLIFA
jgi:hypothetical protein